MGILKKSDPLLGNASGRIGPVVISKSNGVNIVKSIPAIDRKARRKKNKRKPKPAQSLRLSMVSTFISTIKKYTDIGFSKNRHGKAEFPLAVQYNLEHAVTGINPNFSINYPEVVISLGNREMAWSSRISCEDEKTLTVSWEIPDTANIREIGNDLAYVLLYNETKQRTISSGLQVTRSALSISLQIYPQLFGCIIHAYIFFVSPDKKFLSRSDYVGSAAIPSQTTNPSEPLTETQPI